MRRVGFKFSIILVRNRVHRCDKVGSVCDCSRLYLVVYGFRQQYEVIGNDLKEAEEGRICTEFERLNCILCDNVFPRANKLLLLAAGAALKKRGDLHYGFVDVRKRSHQFVFMKVSLLVLSLFAVVGCSQSPVSENSKDMTDFIESQLAKLLEQPEGGFLIINLRDSNNFIQFAGSAVEDLIFDFPTAQLSESQKLKAAAYFQKHWIDAENNKLTTHPGGEPAGTINTYSRSFSRDTAAAAALATEVLDAVFDVTDPNQIETEGL
jgi:hypothetical protein